MVSELKTFLDGGENMDGGGGGKSWVNVESWRFEVPGSGNGGGFSITDAVVPVFFFFRACHEFPCASFNGNFKPKNYSTLNNPKVYYPGCLF